MNKKIITIITLAIMAVLPFKVNAETCKEYTNHYFFHIALNEWDDEVKSACPSGIDECSQSITWTSDDTAYFPIDEDAENISVSVIENPTWANINNTYHPVLVSMINGKTNVYTKSGTVAYYLQSSSKNLSFEYPWFVRPGIIEDSSSVRNTVLTKTLSGGYLYSGVTGFNTNKPTADWDIINDYIEISLNNRVITVVPSVLANSTLDIEAYDGDSESGKSRVLILPQIVSVKYEICDEEIADTYTITYDPNGGEGSRVRDYWDYSTATSDRYQIRYNTMFEREGYKFIGWNESKTATTANTMYSEGSKYAQAKDLTLYAVWQPVNSETKQYTITYNKNDGTNTSNSVKVNSGVSYVIDKNVYERSGYKFVGWSTDKDATNADSEYEPGDKYIVNKDLNLYAVWVKSEGVTGTTETEKHGLGYSLGILGTILAATGGGIVYFKRRNKFENI